MIKGIYVNLLCVLPFSLNAQNNLVPNPSFEIYNNCPNGAGQIDKAIFWFQPNTIASSTDYFNGCASTLTGISVPNNLIGNQTAFTGIAYSGLQSWSYTSNRREYIEIELTDSLISGEEYCASFYVSLPEIVAYAVDGIGALLSDSAIYYSSPSYGVLTFLPQIKNATGNIISDTVNWVLIQGSFIASGGEKFMTIGNFKNDSLTDTLMVNPAGAQWSYFYIDDVSVVQGSCNVVVNEIKQERDKVIVYPNPTSGIVQLKNVGQAFIEVLDAEGRVVLTTVTKDYVDLSSLENGVYLLKAILLDGKRRYGKVMLCK